MIERQSKLDDEVVGCIISGMSVLNIDDSSSEDGSMPGLQERARSDSSSGDDTDSLCGSELYEDGEPWGYQEQTLKQIISGASVGLSLAADMPTLYAFSMHGHAKVLTIDIPESFMQVDLTVKNETNVIPTSRRIRTIRKEKRNGTIKSRLVKEVGDADFCQAQE